MTSAIFVQPHVQDFPSRSGTVRRPCPHCGKSKQDTALSITRKPDGAVVWFCHRCEDRGAWTTNRIIHSQVPTFKPAAPVECVNDRERHDRTMHAILAGCRAISPDDSGGRYLAHRSLPLPENDVLFHPCLRDHTGQQWPCMVAKVTDALTNELRTLHRTFVTADGQKAPIDRPRSPLKGGHKKGGVIRLFADEDVTLGLGIAEGIETALSAVVMGFSPVWACIDAGNLAAFPVLAGINALTIFIDNDEPNPRTGRSTGKSAFAAVAARWLDAGREVRHILPPHGDLNDYLTGHTA